MTNREHRRMLREFAGEDVEDDAIDEELADLRLQLAASEARVKELGAKLTATEEREAQGVRLFDQIVADLRARVANQLRAETTADARTRRAVVAALERAAEAVRPWGCGGARRAIYALSPDEILRGLDE